MTPSHAQAGIVSHPLRVLKQVFVLEADNGVFGFGSALDEGCLFLESREQSVAVLEELVQRRIGSGQVTKLHPKHTEAGLERRTFGLCPHPIVVVERLREKEPVKQRQPTQVLFCTRLPLLIKYLFIYLFTIYYFSDKKTNHFECMVIQDITRLPPRGTCRLHRTTGTGVN